jgi:hypothetical protein
VNQHIDLRVCVHAAGSIVALLLHVAVVVNVIAIAHSRGSLRNRMNHVLVRACKSENSLLWKRGSRDGLFYLLQIVFFSVVHCFASNSVDGLMIANGFTIANDGAVHACANLRTARGG